jgi:hypothetical protein
MRLHIAISHQPSAITADLDRRVASSVSPRKRGGQLMANG